MREIKFRVWSDFYNDWVESFCIKDGRVHLGHVVHYPGNQVNDAILMQYTGLKDKNGKEIYEGDIVTSANGDSGEVIFRNGMFVRRVNGEWGQEIQSYHEVIGNIYENPELLGASK